MADKPTIKFNGADYEAVPLDEFTIDEALILWDYAKMGPDEVVEVEGFHPGVVKALIHVAVARARPDVSARELGRLIGAVPLAKLDDIFQDISEEVDDPSVPPPSGPEPESKTDESNGSSGDGSSSGGARPLAVIPGDGSGPLGSALSADSGRVMSVG